MITTVAFINPRLSTRNVGDCFIEDSVRRILAYDDAHVRHIDPRMPVTAAEVDSINACDAAVIVGTNLWYRSMQKPGRWMFSVQDLRNIRVPIIPVGVGTSRRAGDDNGFDQETLTQLRIVHGSCRLASARDQRTAEALAEAGIRNVVMTGCPTLFRSLLPQWQINMGKPTRRVVLTVRKGQKRNVRLLLRLLQERQWQPVVAVQKAEDQSLQRQWPFFRKQWPSVFEFAIDPYLRLIADSYGAIGWRLHGNMLHLAMGNPAVFFANNSRCQSFCESFHLPYVYCEDGAPLTTGQIADAVDRLRDPGAFSAFPAQYALRYSEMVGFLEANGLKHNLTASIAAPCDPTSKHPTAT